MKIIIRLRIAILLLIVGSTMACTHNNGDIGPLFGKWKLMSIEIDGKVDANYKGDIFFGFQSGVANMIFVDKEHDYDQRIGHWTLEGDKFNLIYDDTRFEPFPQIYFKVGSNMCKLKTLNDKELIFTLDGDGHIYKYNFVKW